MSEIQELMEQMARGVCRAQQIVELRKGRQINVLEPYEMKLIRFHEAYAELRIHGYVLAKVHFLDLKFWSCRIGRRTFQAVSLDDLFQQVVKWKDQETYRERAADLEFYSVKLGNSGYSRHGGEDEALVESAAASLGMGTQFLPSCKYSKNY